MKELYYKWTELVEAGECRESFEDWYSGLIDAAEYYVDLER